MREGKKKVRACAYASFCGEEGRREYIDICRCKLGLQRAERIMLRLQQVFWERGTK